MSFYSTLLFLHSVFRWFVLVFLVYAMLRAYRGWKNQKTFTRHDNFIRHTTATVAHIQLMIGITLYFISPIIQYFLGNFKESLHIFDLLFFGLIHVMGMFIAIIIITIGSALAKRKTNDSEKFKTMCLWFGLALLIIFMAIPWPFSPLANRPYWRSL